MDNSNFPSSYPERQPARGSKNTIIGLLAVALVASLGYAIYSGNSKQQVVEQQQTQIAKVTDEKTEIRKNFDASLSRLDSMSGLNNKLQAKLQDQNSEIAKRKSEIRSILNKKNATAADLAKAKELVGQLNDKITTMEADVARLTQDNANLTQDKVALTADNQKLTSDLTTTTTAKQDLEKKVDVASTLNASNITITPLDVKSDGKEKVTTKAKRVDKLDISFDVENRIAQPGSTDVYVVVTAPDGKIIPVQSADATTFTTREEGDKTYSGKVAVDIETNKTKNVHFALSPGNHFEQGNYTIQIYQNGFKIGEGTRELKKGGIFG